MFVSRLLPAVLSWVSLVSLPAQASTEDAIATIFPENPAGAYVLRRYLDGKGIRWGPLQRHTNGEKMRFRDRGVNVGTGPWVSGSHASAQPYPRASFEYHLDRDTGEYAILIFTMRDPEGCVSAFGASDLSGAEKAALDPRFEAYAHGLQLHLLYKPSDVRLTLTHDPERTCITRIEVKGPWWNEPQPAAAFAEQKAASTEVYVPLWASLGDAPPYQGDAPITDWTRRVELPAGGVVLAATSDRRRALVSYGDDEAPLYYIGGMEDGRPHGRGLIATARLPDAGEALTLQSVRQGFAETAFSRLGARKTGMTSTSPKLLFGSFVEGRPHGLLEVEQGKYGGRGSLTFDQGVVTGIGGELLLFSAGVPGQSDFYYEGALVDGQPRDASATLRFVSGSYELGHKAVGVPYEGDAAALLSQPVRLFNRSDELTYVGSIGFEDQEPVANGYGIYHHRIGRPGYVLEGYFDENTLSTRHTARLTARGYVLVGTLRGFSDVGDRLPDDLSRADVDVYHVDDPHRRARLGTLGAGWAPEGRWFVEEKVDGRWREMGSTDYRRGRHCAGSGENFFGLDTMDCSAVLLAEERGRERAHREWLAGKAEREAARRAELQAGSERAGEAQIAAMNEVFASGSSAPARRRSGVLMKLLEEYETYRRLVVRNTGSAPCAVRILPLRGSVIGGMNRQIGPERSETVLLTSDADDIRLDTSCVTITTEWE